MNIDLHPRFQKRAQGLSPVERGLVAKSLQALQDGFGYPHLHSGLGVRRLRKDMFECRASRRLRIIFFAQKGLLTAYDIMTHDEIQDWLRRF